MCWRRGIAPASPLEDLERLEQLRLIEADTIATFEVEHILSVDTTSSWSSQGDTAGV